MDSLGNEVTVKVKDAIRAKLKEMNANSSDEIIDYIMLLVTTKKSSSELTKSIDFLMENNTSIFVKWLSTIIKKLQQVTVSTTESNISENLQLPKEKNIINNNQSNKLITSEADVKLDDCNKEKKELILNTNNKNMQTFNREREDNCLLKLNVSKSAKCAGNNLSSLVNQPNKIRQKICFSQTENNDSIKTNSSVIALKKKIINSNEKIDCKSKRPRISINSDDEDDKNTRFIPPVTTKEKNNEITNVLLKNHNKASMSQVIVVKPISSKKDIIDTKKKLFVHDLIVQRVDHQRGALALDTAFKYIQQQIGASDKEISVIKKWRDYAVEMLRTNKKS